MFDGQGKHEADLIRIFVETMKVLNCCHLTFLPIRDHDHKPYNLMSDVYTFSIIVWEMLATQTPYVHVRSVGHHVRHVTVENGRPRINESWPFPIRGMLESSFDSDIGKRPVRMFNSPRMLYLRTLTYLPIVPMLLSFTKENESVVRCH